VDARVGSKWSNRQSKWSNTSYSNICCSHFKTQRTVFPLADLSCLQLFPITFEWKIRMPRSLIFMQRPSWDCLILCVNSSCMQDILNFQILLFFLVHVQFAVSSREKHLWIWLRWDHHIICFYLNICPTFVAFSSTSSSSSSMSFLHPLGPKELIFHLRCNRMKNQRDQVRKWWNNVWESVKKRQISRSYFRFHYTHHE
jgi:hypothetical protein